MRTFLIIWFGQLVSLLGSAMTRFALLIWAYDQTGSATALALLGFFYFAGYVAISPIAGVWVDRLDRRLLMLWADLGAAAMTALLIALFLGNSLEVWHLYVLEALTGAFEAFQIPAYAAATTLLVPKTQYMRASGLRSLAFNGSRVVGPALAGLLLPFIHLSGIMLMDLATFLVAASTLLIVRVPRPTQEDASHRGRLWRQLRVGWEYIWTRPGLAGLASIFMGMNFLGSLTLASILPAMILARTDGAESVLAGVYSMLGVGGVVGGVLVSTWGGPKRKIHAILIGAALSFLLGDFLFATGQGLEVWLVAAFVTTASLPLLMGANRAIWQAKVAPGVQGRAFSLQGMLGEVAMSVGYLLAGPLADRVFEPAMSAQGALAETFGWLVGVGPGAGMALMFVCTSILGTAMSLSGYLFPFIRNVETDLPDHDH